MGRQVLPVVDRAGVCKVCRRQGRAVLFPHAGGTAGSGQIAKQAHARRLAALEHWIFQKRGRDVGLQLADIQLENFSGGEQLWPQLLHRFLLLGKLHGKSLI